MDEHDLRGLIDRVRNGRVSRRAFVRRMMAVGIAAPFATQLLAQSGVAMAQTVSAYKPTKRGGGGALKVLWWQAVTLLNPHFATGTKDQDGSRIFYEPLAAWDPDGNLKAVLAIEVPSRENGGLAADGKSVTWKLKQGVTWHDGKPFTADDVVFNWEYAANPATSAVTSGSYKDILVEKIDAHTVRVLFKTPQPFWADAFVGATGQIIPKHLFEDFTGAKSRDAPTNLKPIGTGPYKFKDFRPGDTVSGEINMNYHQPNRPYFDSIEMKGGGDAVSAARAVLQTGEYDFAWNLQVEDEVLIRLEKGGKGHVQITEGAGIEHIQLNNTDPWTEVDGERSSIKTQHPILGDPAVRQALALLVDRDSVQQHIYGRTGIATASYVNNPARFRSTNIAKEYSIDRAGSSGFETLGHPPRPAVRPRLAPGQAAQPAAGGATMSSPQVPPARGRLSSAYSGMTFLGIAAPIRNVATEFSKTPYRSLRRLRCDFFEEIGLGVMPPVRMVAVPSSLILILSVSKKSGYRFCRQTRVKSKGQSLSGHSVSA